MNHESRERAQRGTLDYLPSAQNVRFPEASNRETHGYIAHCTAPLTIPRVLDAHVIADMRFGGARRGSSQASPSAPANVAGGEKSDTLNMRLDNGQGVVTGEEEFGEELLGKLANYENVSEFPMCVKCATLSWHPMQHAIAGDSKIVTTELCYEQ